MRRLGIIELALIAAMTGLPTLAGTAAAQTASSAAVTAAPTELSAQSRSSRPPTRLRVYPRYQPDDYGVYPRYFPGRNAVRDCTAYYVQEYRPSGTVIVPRMNCFWRRG